MGAEYSPEILDEYRILFRVPKPALINLLLSREEAELQAALTPITRIDPPISQTLLAQLTHTNLILVIQSCHSISIEQIRELHDEYRYRGMKTLYLYEFSPNAPLQISQETLDQLNALIGDVRQDIGVHIANFENPEFRDRDFYSHPNNSSRRTLLLVCCCDSIY